MMIEKLIQRWLTAVLILLCTIVHSQDSTAPTAHTHRTPLPHDDPNAKLAIDVSSLLIT
jgi:hypothetical protein